MLIPNDPDVPTQIECHSFEQEDHSTQSDADIAPKCTDWPSDAPRPPFIVGGTYTFPDIYGHERTALIYTEQWARVGSSWWHVGSVPDDAVFRDMFTPDAEMVADAERVALEVLNSQRWS